jgi:hypothetical protein
MRHTIGSRAIWRSGRQTAHRIARYGDAASDEVAELRPLSGNRLAAPCAVAYHSTRLPSAFDSTEPQLQELCQYTVAAYTGLHQVREQRPSQATTATTPESAAELVLGECLVRLGRVSDLRARVSYEDADGRDKQFCSIAVRRNERPPRFDARASLPRRRFRDDSACDTQTGLRRPLFVRPIAKA